VRFEEQIIEQKRVRAAEGRANPASLLARAPGIMPLSGPQAIERVPIIVNLLLYAGDDLGFALVMYEPDGTDADLSDATVRSQIRATPAAADIAGEVLCGIEDNVIQLHLLGEVTQNLPPAAVWDVELTRHGLVTTLVNGTVRTTPDVTR